MNTSSEFALNFSIPQGPTGPIGPNPAICYIDYKPSTDDRNLSINSSKIFHSNGEFSVKEDTVMVNPGTYEITFCGQIEAAGNFQNSIMLSISEDLGNNTSQTINGMAMVLPEGTLSTHFSETRIITFNNTKNIIIKISNKTGVAARISLVSLIFKKIMI